MKTHLSWMIFGHTLLFLINTSCTHFVPQKSSKVVSANATKVPPFVSHSAQAVWYLHSPHKLSLYFRSLDNGRAASMILGPGINKLPMKSGHWEITGFEQEGQSFTSLNISKKFVFKMQSKNLTYAGSIIVGCPRVGDDGLRILKAMSFFNRYPFSSTSHLCELIVGNDISVVRSELKKDRNNKDLTIISGF